MHKIRETSSLSLLFAGACLLCRCTLGDLAGGGTEDVNTLAVTGLVFNQDGTPAPFAQVLLHPADYDPVRDAGSGILTDTTGETGEYRFTVREPGFYTAQIVHVSARTRAMAAGVAVRGDTTVFPRVALSKPGILKVFLPDSINTISGYLYIPGTTIEARLGEAGAFALIDSVPAGTVPSVNYGVPAALPRTIRFNVPVAPAETTTVAQPGWRYAARCVLNTTSTGAGIAGNVMNFPVLVRLNKGNFAFNQAQANGEDLLFANENGVPLAYEIELWDAGTGLAAIWVRVDTVYGNDSTQSIIMYWGNSLASGSSNGAVVFDAATGFEGAWHLNETSGTHAADASHNGFTGTYRGGLPKGVSGQSGICQNILRPDSDYVDMGNVLNPGVKDMSVGVWVKRASFGSPQALIAKTNGDTPSDSFGYLFSFDPYNFLRFHIASGGVRWGDDGAFNVSAAMAVSDTAWHYVFAVIDRSNNSRCKIYIDGVDKTGSTEGNIASVAAVSNPLRLCIGTENDNNCSYNGTIAEATVAFQTRSADWVRLSYMNQKEQNALVKW